MTEPTSDQPVPVPIPAAEPAPVPSGPGWFHRFTAVLFIVFCFEVGLFLLVYPWTDSWADNYFAWALRGSAQAAWHGFWNNSYVRGAISGMGIVNLWIAIAELFRLFSRPPATGN